MPSVPQYNKPMPKQPESNEYKAALWESGASQDLIDKFTKRLAEPASCEGKIRIKAKRLKRKG